MVASDALAVSAQLAQPTDIRAQVYRAHLLDFSADGKINGVSTLPRSAMRSARFARDRRITSEAELQPTKQIKVAHLMDLLRKVKLYIDDSSRLANPDDPAFLRRSVQLTAGFAAESWSETAE